MARNWARRGKEWHPLDELPAKAKAILFANADHTVQWLVVPYNGGKPPKGENKVHRGLADLAAEYDDGGVPVMDDETHDAATFAFVDLL